MDILTDTTVLTGTWPVRTHANRFFGTLQADGQHPRVAGLACDDGDVVALSLVGYETSTSAVLASLWMREAIPFLLAPEVEWRGPRTLRRKAENYKQFSIQLATTKESHYIALPFSAHIREGILHPPDLPNPKEEDIPAEEEGASRRPETLPITLPKVDRSRYVLGNWDEETPHQRGFLGHLYGMRVLFLHKDEEHTEWPNIWAAELWKRGRARALVEPLRFVLGMKVWKLSDDLEAWGRLIGSGTQEGWLPWRATLPPEAQEQTAENRALSAVG